MLVFIDTNIFLDFYRMGSGESAHRALKQIDEIKNHVITTYQVEMEFKKNRQRTIIETIKGIKQVDGSHKTMPPLLIDAQPTKIIRDNLKNIETQQKKIKTRINRILQDPTRNDDVYRCAQRLFKSTSELNLNRDNEVRYKIRRLAWKRFVLGYPPRKNTDTSIGDAVNWEWIVHCAKEKNDDAIIVSRDADFGVFHNKDSYINDWLKQEFKSRVNQRKSVRLTNKLSDVFKELKIKVRQEDEKEEDAIIEKYKELMNISRNVNRDWIQMMEKEEGSFDDL
jgi:predicted nucleic acid-binding protein